MKKGWETKTLGEICEIERGGSPRPIENFITTDPSGVNWIKIGDATASGKYIYKTQEKIKPEGIKRSRMVHEGDFILSNSMSFGRPYIMKTEGCIHDGWLVLHQPKVDQNYLYYVLSSDLVFNQFDRLAAGSTVRNLNIGLAKSVKIPYPPLPEQQRIVGILDEAFEGIATAKANTGKNLQNARAIFESHLNAVFTLRGEGWVEKKLGDVCEVKDGTHASPQYVDEGIPFVTQKNIRQDGLSFEKTNYITRDDHNDFYRRSNVAFGDILISMIGANRGMACIVDDERTFSIKNVGLVKQSHSINQCFLLYFLKSPQAASYVRSASNGGAQEFVGLTELRQFPIPLPPLEHQNALAEQFQALRQETQNLATLCVRKLATLEELKKSLLHQAFNGEL